MKIKLALSLMFLTVFVWQIQVDFGLAGEFTTSEDILQHSCFTQKGKDEGGGDIFEMDCFKFKGNHKMVIGF